MCWNYEKGMKKTAYPVDMPLFKRLPPWGEAVAEGD